MGAHESNTVNSAETFVRWDLSAVSGGECQPLLGVPTGLLPAPSDPNDRPNYLMERNTAAVRAAAVHICDLAVVRTRCVSCTAKAQNSSSPGKTYWSSRLEPSSTFPRHTGVFRAAYLSLLSSSTHTPAQEFPPPPFFCS